jgi:hypothetical protein
MTRPLSRFLAILCFAALPALAKDAAPETLIAHTVTLEPRGAGAAYVDLHDGKAYDEKGAAAHKADLDFVYLLARDATSVKRELYDLSGHDTNLPPEVSGNHAGLVSLGWDDDLVAKCKTVADLKRMAGSYTANSFSFYGTMANNAKGDLDNKRYMFLDAHGRMGFFSIKPGAGDALVLEIKITPEPFFK